MAKVQGNCSAPPDAEALARLGRGAGARNWSSLGLWYLQTPNRIVGDAYGSVRLDPLAYALRIPEQEQVSEIVHDLLGSY